MIRRIRGMLAVAALALPSLTGCEATQPKQVENPDPLGIGASDESLAEVDETDSDAKDDPSREQSPAKSVEGEPMGADPTFTDSMTVDEAIQAVPPDADRLNIEQERLAEPLQQSDLYEPCKLGAGHFKARVAVWNGRAVGVDIETQPQNPKLARCLDQQIREVKWSDKVRSLNTVEYSY